MMSRLSRALRRPRIVALACLCVFAPATRAAHVELEAYLAHIAHTLPAQAQVTVARVDGAPRKLLAIRSYVRAADGLSERWSWSDAQIARFVQSEEFNELLAEVERVRDAFERQNPGYSLYANTEVRSLDVQISRWNANAGVWRTAKEIHRVAEAELRRGYPQAPDAGSIERFRSFLRAWRPTAPAPLAAPGLSLHGQSRAIDFQVVQGDRVVASTQVASVRGVWEAQGWSAKLRRAVGDAGFVGPLTSPNEPWHYEYSPSPPSLRASAGAVGR